jgi:hypothetical protein
VRESLRINLADITTHGPADGLVVYYAADGTAGPSIPIGGSELDTLRAITAVDDRIIVAGTYAGTFTAGRELVRSAGGGDAFVAILSHGTVVRVDPIAGPGREEVVALAPLAGAYAAGVTHTAGGAFAREPVRAPADPLTGAALLVRPIR